MTHYDCTNDCMCLRCINSITQTGFTKLRKLSCVYVLSAITQQCLDALTGMLSRSGLTGSWKGHASGWYQMASKTGQRAVSSSSLVNTAGSRRNGSGGGGQIDDNQLHLSEWTRKMQAEKCTELFHLNL